MDPSMEAHMSMRRLALVTDAWKPQTNGVVNTLVRLVKHMEAQGIEVLVIAPDGHRTMPLPSYPEIRIALDPWKAIKRIRAFEPDAVHVATEGPLGFWTIGWLRRRGLRFTTSFHTRYAEYLSARLPVPLEWGYKLVRWFHARAEHTLVSSQSLLRELQSEARRPPSGALAARRRRRVFNPQSRRDEVYDLPRPIWLYVGRVAVEKSLEDFLALPLPGTKVVVGDGPHARGCSAASRRRLARLSLRRRSVGALRQRRLLRLPVAHRDLRQRDARGDGLRPAGRIGARAGSRRPSSEGSTAPSTTPAGGMQAGGCAARATRRGRASRAARLQAGHEVFRAHLVPVSRRRTDPPRTGAIPGRPAALPPRAVAIPQHAAG